MLRLDPGFFETSQDLPPTGLKLNYTMFVLERGMSDCLHLGTSLGTACRRLGWFAVVPRDKAQLLLHSHATVLWDPQDLPKVYHLEVIVEGQTQVF